MIPACITTLLWSFCIVASRRSVEHLGENAANFWRILIAVLTLGILSHATNAPFHASSFRYFFLSGLIGFGLGDVGLYFALSRIGSRLTVLMSQCVAVPIAFGVEWLWLGNILSWQEGGAIIVILSGIVLALMPKWDDLPKGTRMRFAIGVLFGLVAAAGQAGGGVLSRLAYHAQGTLDEPTSTIDGILMGAAAGYQRLLGGVLLIGAVYLAGRLYSPWRTPPSGPHANDPAPTKFNWVLINALTGPIIGIIFFQWALMTTETAIVQSIVALTPLTVIPLAYWIEGERPQPRSIVGGVIAVSGVILLGLAPGVG